MLQKLSLWACLEIRMQDEIAASGEVINPLKGCRSSDI
jgi:hypothetical protein